MCIRTRRLSWFLLIAGACLVSACGHGAAAAKGDAVIDEGGASEYYLIPNPEANVRYSWGLPLLTTKRGRHVRLTAIRLLHAPREVRDIEFVRIRYTDLGTGIGVIKTPGVAAPNPSYKPWPAIGANYGDVDEYQILLEFSLSAPVVGGLSGIEIKYVEDGLARTQQIPAELKLGRTS